MSSDLVNSQLFDDWTFYNRFREDLKHSKQEVIIESPFITSQRVSSLVRDFEHLISKKVRVYIITRSPEEHDLNMKHQAEEAIRRFETIGVHVILSSEYSHRKLAIVDRKILWEGSLNILSQTYSKEFMRRIESESLANECFEFVKLGKFIY